MSEWLKEHAWKLIPLARADAHRDAPTPSPSATSRNNDVCRRLPVNHGVCPGFQGVSGTVLTQNSVAVSALRTDVRQYAWRCDRSIECTAVLNRYRLRSIATKLSAPDSDRPNSLHQERGACRPTRACTAAPARIRNTTARDAQGGIRTSSHPSPFPSSMNNFKPTQPTTMNAASMRRG